MTEEEKDRIRYFAEFGCLTITGDDSEISYYSCGYFDCFVCKFQNTCGDVDHDNFTKEYTDEYINELKETNPEWFL